MEHEPRRRKVPHNRWAIGWYDDGVRFDVSSFESVRTHNHPSRAFVAAATDRISMIGHQRMKDPDVAQTASWIASITWSAL